MVHWASVAVYWSNLYMVNLIERKYILPDTFYFYQIGAGVNLQRIVNTSGRITWKVPHSLPCKSHTSPASPEKRPWLWATPATPHTVCSASCPLGEGIAPPDSQTASSTRLSGNLILSPLPLSHIHQLESWISDTGLLCMSTCEVILNKDWLWLIQANDSEFSGR